MFIYLHNVLKEAIIFALYVFVCTTLMKPRFSRAVSFISYAGTILCSVCVSAALFLSGRQTTALTLLPLTAYLPFSICLYIISENGIFEAATACSVGALSSLIIKTINKILRHFLVKEGINGLAYDIVPVIATFILASAMAFTVYRFIRKYFKAHINANKQNSLIILIPSSTLLLLIFYNLNSLSSSAVMIMTLAVAVAFFTVAARLFAYSSRAVEAEQNERRLSESLEAQRRNLEAICQSVEAGRHYRHDMRHHLKVLSGMAMRDNSAEILSYIGELSATAELCEPELYCKNPSVNAVVSEYMNRAKKLGCKIKNKILIPENIPFDLPDVCVILSNALENALNACEKCPDDDRRIDLLADFSDEKKLTISVSNTCCEAAEIDGDGLPVIKKRTDGHGIGLHSVRQIAEKYNGFLCCECQSGQFYFNSVIFCQSGTDGSSTRGDTVKKRVKALPSVLALLICAIGILNISPASAYALSDALSIEIKTISYGWGDNKFNAELPGFSGENSDSLNKASEEFIDMATDIFWKYAITKYEGFVSEDSGYKIITDNEKYMSVRFYATLNIGGSMDYQRYITIDKLKDKELTLSDLFDENYDYIGSISEEILRQMRYRVDNEHANYFIPGGIWRDDECFKEISPQQNFYLNPEGKLVIAFNEYEVAPGSMGCPEFEMPDEIFKPD